MVTEAGQLQTGCTLWLKKGNHSYGCSFYKCRLITTIFDTRRIELFVT